MLQNKIVALIFIPIFMKYLSIFFLFIILSCNSGTQQFRKAENALDAGREFIDATLKGDFKKAAFYTLPDSQNIAYLQQVEKVYLQKSSTEKKEYNNAVINIKEVTDLSQNITVITYSNSFDNKPHTIKIIYQNNQWMVDLKYTINGNL